MNRGHRQQEALHLTSSTDAGAGGLGVGWGGPACSARCLPPGCPAQACPGPPSPAPAALFGPFVPLTGPRGYSADGARWEPRSSSCNTATLFPSEWATSPITGAQAAAVIPTVRLQQRVDKALLRRRGHRGPRGSAAPATALTPAGPPCRPPAGFPPVGSDP